MGLITTFFVGLLYESHRHVKNKAQANSKLSLKVSCYDSGDEKGKLTLFSSLIFSFGIVTQSIIRIELLE